MNVGEEIKLNDGTAAKVVCLDEDIIVAKTEFGTVYLTKEGLFKDPNTPIIQDNFGGIPQS